MTHEEYRNKLIECVNIYHELDNMPQILRERTYKQLLDALDAEYKESCSCKTVYVPELTLIEFIGRVRPSSNLDTTTAIIYYKTVYERYSSVRQEEINAAYSELQRTPPANLVQNLRELASVKYDNRIVFRGGLASIAEEGRRFIKKQLDDHEHDVTDDAEYLTPLER